MSESIHTFGIFAGFKSQNALATHDDPHKAAATWAKILNRPLEDRIIRLDGSQIRFVPIVDGRGPGVSAYDVKVVDRERVLAAAEKRGKKRGPSQVEVCGCRINLV